MTTRVLCLDHEGGHGGSSRSLYFLLAGVDRAQVSPEVWCGRTSHLVEGYRERGIPCEIMPRAPRYSARARLSDNLVELARCLLGLVRARTLRRELRAAARTCDVIHMNHESLFLLAAWLRVRCRVGLTMHVRTRPPVTRFATFQARTIARIADETVFITDNERTHWQQLAGRPFVGVVINNAAELRPVPAPPSHHPGVSLVVASLTNNHWSRGTDRLVDIAVALASRGRTDIRFVMAGDLALGGSPPGPLRTLEAKGGTLADHAEANGVAAQFDFLGHVLDPEGVLRGADVLVKPTREGNPWGRDVIEAMVAGRPVASVGSWQGFIADGETGLLQETFDVEQVADWLERLADDPELRHRLGAAARARAEMLFDPDLRGGELARVWERVSVRR